MFETATMIGSIRDKYDVNSVVPGEGDDEIVIHAPSQLPHSFFKWATGRRWAVIEIRTSARENTAYRYKLER